MGKIISFLFLFLFLNPLVNAAYLSNMKVINGVSEPVPVVFTGSATVTASGGATAANQQTQINQTSSATAIASATAASVASIDLKTPALVGGRQPVDGSGVTQPISAVALPLPSGAATSANQNTQISLATSATAFASATATNTASIAITSNSTATNTSQISNKLTDGTQRTLVADQVGNLMPVGDAPARASFNKLTDGTNTAAVDSNGNQRHTIRNPQNPNAYASVSNGNRLRVTVEPSSQASDKFDGASLDLNLWTPSTCGTGVVSTGTGNLSLVNGTTTSNCSYITTIDNSPAPGNASLQFGASMMFENPIVTNTRRYWGFATGGGSYASPLTDGVVYEIDEAQAVRASIYKGGVRVFSQVLSASCAFDGGWHRWDIFYNTMNIAWYIDCVGGQDLPAAQVTNGTNPNVQNLPARLAAFNNTAASPSGTPSMLSQAFAVTDTAHNGQFIVDGRYGTRRLTVGKNGDARVSTKTPLTQSNAFSVTVGTSSTIVVGANASRGGLNFVNEGNSAAYCTFNGTSISGTAYVIPPNYGAFNMNEGMFFTSQMKCSTKTGTAILTGAEGSVP